MASVKGTVVSVRKTTTSYAGIGEYSLTMEASVADITVFGDASRARTMVLKDWSGDFSGYYDHSDTNQAASLDMLGSTSALAATTELRLYDSTGGYWYGSAVITPATVRAVTDGVLEVSFSFMGNGSLAHST